jgi:hypothetical protein
MALDYIPRQFCSHSVKTTVGNDNRRLISASDKHIRLVDIGQGNLILVTYH